MWLAWGVGQGGAGSLPSPVVWPVGWLDVAGRSCGGRGAGTLACVGLHAVLVLVGYIARFDGPLGRRLDQRAIVHHPRHNLHDTHDTRTRHDTHAHTHTRHTRSKKSMECEQK